jgi:hypothetical protein
MKIWAKKKKKFEIRLADLFPHFRFVSISDLVRIKFESFTVCFAQHSLLKEIIWSPDFSILNIPAIAITY